MGSVHNAAADGFASNADGYARGRPDYPVALDAWLRDTIGLAAGKTVVDLGAGTGKFVPRLRATGAAVIAIEPVDAMRAKLAAAFPDVDARAGTADAMPLATASIDAVVCAQAFHWFATDAATAEIARVLKPGGVLALVWNVRDERMPFMRRVTELLEPYEGDAPRYAKGTWRRAFPAAGFGPLVEARFAHVHRGPPEQVILDRFLSVSFVAAAPPKDRERIATGLRELVAAEPALAGKAEVEIPYTTVAFHAHRDGSRPPD
jgi:SAM-dependent methyltransferase